MSKFVVVFDDESIKPVMSYLREEVLRPMAERIAHEFVLSLPEDKRGNVGRRVVVSWSDKNGAYELRFSFGIVTVSEEIVNRWPNASLGDKKVTVGGCVSMLRSMFWTVYGVVVQVNGNRLHEEDVGLLVLALEAYEKNLAAVALSGADRDVMMARAKSIRGLMMRLRGAL